MICTVEIDPSVTIRVERTALGTQDDDRLRNGVGDSAKLFLVVLQRDLSALQVVNVGAGPVPSDDVTQLVTQRLHPDQEPSVLAIVAPQTGFDLARFPKRQEGEPPLHQRVDVIGMEGDLPSPAARLLRRDTGIVVPSLVQELVGAVG